MGKVERKRQATVDFWEGYARWYQQWMEHNRYHDAIVNILLSLARPNWRVLDIGAGNGVLSRPLRRMGCQVTALEPSAAMRRLLRAELGKEKTRSFRIDKRRWEDVSSSECRNYELIIACNSLHLTHMGFTSSLEKIFAARPRRVVVVSEFYSPEMRVPACRDNYHLNLARFEKVESSHAYHNLNEAFEHWTAMMACSLDSRQKSQIQTNLVPERNHLWSKDEAHVGTFCWQAASC